MIRFLPVLLLLLFVNTAAGQTSGGIEIVKPRILFGEWNRETKHIPVAIEFTMAPEWHLYWINPGDAGSPPEIKWSLPAGWSAGELDFPVPEKHEVEGIVSYVYFGKLVLATELVAPENPIGKNITADLKWMVCKDLCVPGKATMKVSVQPSAGVEQLVAAAKVPTLTEAGYSAQMSPDVVVTGKSAHYEFYVSGDLQDFYPALSETPIVARISPGGLKLKVSDTSMEIRDRLNGIAIIDGKGYWLR
jgi:DsbC/DsbD-like thiol-disulfide interchange protein